MKEWAGKKHTEKCVKGYTGYRQSPAFLEQAVHVPCTMSNVLTIQAEKPTEKSISNLEGFCPGLDEISLLERHETIQQEIRVQKGFN